MLKKKKHSVDGCNWRKTAQTFTLYNLPPPCLIAHTQH